MGLPLALSPLLQAGAILLIAFSGLAAMWQAHSMAARCFLGGVGLIGIAVWAQEVPTMHATAAFNTWTMLSGVGAVAIFVAGRVRMALSIVLISLLIRLLIPSYEAFSVALWGSPWALLLLGVFSVPAAVFFGIWVLQRVLRSLFGSHAAGHVTGELLLRVLDRAGGGMKWLVLSPARWMGRYRK